MKETRSISLRRYAVAVIGMIVVTLVPTATDAQPLRPSRPGDDPNSSQAQQARVRAKRGEVSLQVNALQARTSELNAALKKLATNVARQQSRFREAQRRLNQANQDLADASLAVGEAQQRVAALNADRQRLMVDSFTNPPNESAADALDAENINDAMIKQSLLEIQADRQADVLDRLTAAQEDVEVERQNKADVAKDAKRKRTAARTALARVTAAKAQQQRFADEAESALESKLAEADQLATVDRQLSQKIAREQAELARRLAAAQAAQAAAARRRASAASATPPAIQPAPGGLATVSCSGGGSITVAASIASQLQSMLNAAAGDGIVLCGGGYRDPQQQIALRRAHCGTSYYAIYEAPAGSCSPPTARPGFSMHEQGLAIDFTCNGGGSIESHSNVCYQWLAAHASQYGFHNLPSEAWHWSVNGH